MATTEAGAALTEGHRLAQLGVMSKLIRLFESEWSVGVAFDAAAFSAWAYEMAPEIAAAHALSARTATRYYAAFRAAEGVPGAATGVTLRDDVTPEQFVSRLDRFGPAYARSLLERGLTEDEAIKRALVQMSLSTTQDVLGAGRDTLAASLDMDALALGWQRVPSGKCCAFCAMLASRGPVYKSRNSASLSRRGRVWHRGCKCQPEPVYSRRTALPPEAARYAELWDKVNPADLNEFRRVLERPHLHAPEDEQPDP